MKPAETARPRPCRHRRRGRLCCASGRNCDAGSGRLRGLPEAAAQTGASVVTCPHRPPSPARPRRRRWNKVGNQSIVRWSRGARFIYARTLSLVRGRGRGRGRSCCSRLQECRTWWDREWEPRILPSHIRAVHPTRPPRRAAAQTPPSVILKDGAPRPAPCSPTSKRRCSKRLSRLP